MTANLDEGVGFWALAGRQPNKAAVISGTGVVTSYSDLAAQVNQVSRTLQHLGLGPGRHLAFLLGNQIETYVLALACTQTGILYTPVNRHLTAPEIAYLLEDSESEVFVADDRYAGAAVEAADIAGIPNCLAIGSIEGFTPLFELSRHHPVTPPPNRAPGRPFFYTSGTTGKAKAVLRSGGPSSVAALVTGAAAAAAEIGLTAEGVHLVPGPLHHSGPLGASLNALNIGATVVLMEKWDAVLCLQLIDRYGVTSTQMVPTMFQRLVALPDEAKARYDVSSLRRGVVKHGSSYCPPHIKQEMIRWWGPVLLEVYGGQEGRITMVTSEEWLERPGTVGRADRLTVVKILDDAGKQCARGQVGTIYAQLGPVEYYKAPEKTAASRQGDLFTLGDMGYVDEEGWLFLVDRRVDLIVSGGVNVYPAEVEAVLLRHPGVADVVVVGVPDDEWGHEVKAIVQPADPTDTGVALEAEIISFARQHLARYKCPRSVDFRLQIPRDDLGKIRRFALRDEYLSRNQKDKARS
jgi:long-chain acyl-CoA synthetase